MVRSLVPCLIVWLVFWFGSGVWSMGSSVWWGSGSLRLSAILWSAGRLVGQALGGLFCQSVGRSDSLRVVSLVDRSIVWSSS